MKPKFKVGDTVIPRLVGRWPTMNPDRRSVGQVATVTAVHTYKSGCMPDYEIEYWFRDELWTDNVDECCLERVW